MKYETKYNIGDTVFYLERDQIQVGKIESIRIEHTLNCGSALRTYKVNSSVKYFHEIVLKETYEEIIKELRRDIANKMNRG